MKISYLIPIAFWFFLCTVCINSNKNNKKLPEEQQVDYKFVQRAYMIPHPQKAHRGGEDAFYAGDDMLAVADGVGGWNNRGINPADYSRFLWAQVYYNENPEFYDKNPIQLIVKAHKMNTHIGSSTMAVLTLDGKYLRGCYIGDSGFIVIRKYPNQSPMIIYQFSQQQHYFNYPFQLARQQFNGDDPKQSICVNISVNSGDIVIAGSDGLFDNVFTQQLLATIDDMLLSREFSTQQEQQQKQFQIAKLLAEQAIKRGQNPTFSSPFAEHARDLGIRYQGGKLDDTTIIVARIELRQSFQKISKDKETTQF